VDDEELARDMIAVFLELDGHETTTAAGGEEAMALLARIPFDIVTLDLDMPGQGGVDVLRFISQQGIQVRALVLSASDDVDAIRECARLGAQAFLPKPYDPGEVTAAIRRLAEDGHTHTI
jgi:DNA-binding response OmpR family regulator